jgi:hypothetical protein
MSTLKPGTRCVIIAGCPENIGLIVEVVAHIGAADGYEDGYFITTASGRAFHQVWTGVYDDSPEETSLTVVSTERRKIRPLVELGPESGDLLQTRAPQIATQEI